MQQIVNLHIICTYGHNTVKAKEDISNNTNKYADISRISVGGAAPQTLGGDHPASLRRVLGGLSSEVKRPRPEADLTPHPSAKVKNKWNYTFKAFIVRMQKQSRTQ
jgi:hypothetical protein